MKDKQERYVIVRTYSAGVFAGVFESRKGQEVVLTDARRIWYWKGAASLSQLAMEGTRDPVAVSFRPRWRGKNCSKPSRSWTAPRRRVRPSRR